MLHWLHPPKHKLRKFADDSGHVAIVSDIDPLIFPVIDVAKRNGMQNSDIELVTDELSRMRIPFPTDNEQRFDFMYHTIKVLYEDLNFNDDDQKMLSEIAIAIDLPPAKVNKLITTIYEGFATKSTIIDVKVSFFHFLDK